MAIGHVDVVLAPSFSVENEAVEIDENGAATVEAANPNPAVEHDFVCGSIEVEAVVKEEGGTSSVERILFIPQNAESSLETAEVVERTEVVKPIDDVKPCPDAIPEDNSIAEATDSIMGSLLDTFMGTCGDTDDCKCVPTKSALKKGGEGSQVDRTVSFSKLEIRSFPMTLGDHPGARYGPPMSLDWDSKPNSEVVDLDAYERNRNPRRDRKRLRISIKERENILVKEQGFSYTEIRDAWAAAIEVRKQRLDTLRRSPTAEMMDEAWESASRKFWRLFGAETV